jgi:hypothetical protein
LLSVGPDAAEGVGSVEGAPVYHASLSLQEYRALLSDAGALVYSFVPEDPECDFHSLLLARRCGPAQNP